MLVPLQLLVEDSLAQGLIGDKGRRSEGCPDDYYTDPGHSPIMERSSLVFN